MNQPMNQPNRKPEKYSSGFNRMFFFFVQSYRAGILVFCGERIDIRHNQAGLSAKKCFLHFENGKYKQSPFISTRQPNLLRAAITGKKAWGLWVDQWSDGIAECSFLREEIEREFSGKNIQIPESLHQEFYTRIRKKQSAYLALVKQRYNF